MPNQYLISLETYQIGTAVIFSGTNQAEGSLLPLSKKGVLFLYSGCFKTSFSIKQSSVATTNKSEAIIGRISSIIEIKVNWINRM